MEQNDIRIGGNAQQSVALHLRMANRHGLVAGATVRFANGSGGTPSVSGVTVTGAKAITATVSVDMSGAKGVRTWDVVVTNPGGATATLAGGFAVVK